jgi:hypothetical protein
MMAAADIAERPGPEERDAQVYCGLVDIWTAKERGDSVPADAKIARILYLMGETPETLRTKRHLVNTLSAFAHTAEHQAEYAAYAYRRMTGRAPTPDIDLTTTPDYRLLLADLFGFTPERVDAAVALAIRNGWLGVEMMSKGGDA